MCNHPVSCSYLVYWDYSDFLSSLLARIMAGRSENMRVPPNTRPVPSQWYTVKGFWKYQMLKMRLRNFLRVTTRVTVRLAHSVVSTNTDEMQTY